MKLSGAARPILLCPSSLPWSQKRYVRNICTCISLGRWWCNAVRRSPPPPCPLLDRWSCTDGKMELTGHFGHTQSTSFNLLIVNCPFFSYSNWNAAHLQQLNLPWGCRGVRWSEVDLIALLLSPWKIREGSCAAVLLLTLVSFSLKVLVSHARTIYTCLNIYRYVL